MTRMHTKAPTLAWLLTALTCLLTGMAVTEARRQEFAWPAPPPVGVVMTVEDAFTPTATPEPTPLPTPTPMPTPTPPGPPPIRQPGDTGIPR